MFSSLRRSPRPFSFRLSIGTSRPIHIPIESNHACSFATTIGDKEVILFMDPDGTQRNVNFHRNDAKATARFHAAWLWANDPQHIHASSGQRLRSTSTYFSSQVRIQKAEVIPVEETGVSVSKPPTGSLHPIGGVYQTGMALNIDIESNNSTDEKQRHVLCVTWDTTDDQSKPSYYDMEWLLQCRSQNSEEIAQFQKASIVTKEHAIQSGETLPTFSFPDLMTAVRVEDRNECHYSLLHALWEKGAVRLSHVVPSSPDYSITDNDHDSASLVAQVGKKLSGGRLSHGHLYGDVFRVRADFSNPNNVAFTSLALAPHQDLSYYSTPPGLQLLHCVENICTVNGGESVLMDGLAAAEEFRSLAPDLFDVLTQCDATFLKQREGAEIVYHRPHIQMDSTRTMIVGIHWSPQFEGPLRIASHLVPDYYVAYTAFERMLDSGLPRLRSGAENRLLSRIAPTLEANLCDYAHCFTWEKRFDPGEILILNNLRMLHGRRAFTVDDRSRTDRDHRLLLGCYTDMDDTLNEYRVLRRYLHPAKALTPIRNVGNGSSFQG